MKPCDDYRDDFEFYALGLLDPEAKEEMDAHLRTGCDTCGVSVMRTVRLP